MAGKEQADSVDSKMFRRMRSKGIGWVFTPRDFRDLGSRIALDLALLRHKRAGTIRQLARGLDDVPRPDPQLGTVSPRLHSIATPLEGRGAIRLQPPSVSYAANSLRP